MPGTYLLLERSRIHFFQLSNGTVDTFEQSLVSFLDKSSLSLSHLLVFTTDGARVMTGCHNGVAV